MNHPKRIEINYSFPADPEAEIGVLEACLANNVSVDMARKIIAPEDFSRRAGAEIFKRMLEFRDGGRPFTLCLIDKSFERNSEYEKFRDVFDSLLPVTGETVSHFSRIVKEMSNRRRLIAATCEANEGLFNMACGVDEILDDLVGEITAVREGKLHG